MVVLAETIALGGGTIELTQFVAGVLSRSAIETVMQEDWL